MFYFSQFTTLSRKTFKVLHFVQVTFTFLTHHVLYFSWFISCTRALQSQKKKVIDLIFFQWKLRLHSFYQCLIYEIFDTGHIQIFPNKYRPRFFYQFPVYYERKLLPAMIFSYWLNHEKYNKETQMLYLPQSPGNFFFKNCFTAQKSVCAANQIFQSPFSEC